MIISRTPLRASFFGGGSDFKDYYCNSHGKVLSTALNMYIYICVSKKFDDQIRLSYSTTEIVDSVDEIKHNIIREALKIAEIDKGVDILYTGDIPIGTAGVGLASSSALAVGALNALFAYKGQHVSADFLARKACEIEIDILKHPIGKQDQYATAYGGFNTYLFNSDESVYVNPLICRKEIKNELNRRLMFFYTGITRMSETILSEQKSRVSDTSHYVDRLVEMVDIAQNHIIKEELSEIGMLLREGWELKKKLSSGISNPEIDEYYEKALKAGAVGGKLLGAGGGGFLMFYVDEDKQQAVREALGELREIDAEFEQQGSKIIYVSD